MQSETIENYLKTIYHLSGGNASVVGNKQLADKLNVIPATVTEAVKKLHELKLVVYEKSYGTRLTAAGSKIALTIVRRHRIWETYLAKELGFGWDEVHEIAEELEHIKNDKLIKKLSEKLGHPHFDPHGDPIPDEKGKIRKSNFIKLSEAKVNTSYKITGVTDHSPAFLKYLEKHQLIIGALLSIKNVEAFDNSLLLQCRKKEISVSSKAAECIIVEELPVQTAA
ncbi:MAG: metal-dependent transcriptional regulator [Bacteroidetes bacterium]|jgi:DtxR family Mn-dependent transcriptional regulator|nr:metal-dependent transcriptional regulator [Bacteroidota bacterium]